MVGKKFFGVGRGEDEAGVRGRFFERLEKGVGGRAGDLVRLVDDVDLGWELRGGVAHAFAQIADIVDTAVAGGVDLDDVGGRVLVDGAAIGAGVARPLAGVGMEAVDGFGEEPGRRRLARAARTAEKICVRNAAERHRVAQRAHHVLLADELFGVERLGRCLRYNEAVAAPCLSGREGRVPDGDAIVGLIVLLAVAFGEERRSRHAVVPPECAADVHEDRVTSVRTQV